MTESQQVYGLPPPQQEPEPKTPTTTIAALAGLGMAALCFLLVGLGFAFGVFSDDEDQTDADVASAVAPASTETGPSEPAPELAGAEQVPSATADRAPVVEPSNHEGNELVPTAPVGGEGGNQGSASGGGSGSRAGSGGSATAGGGPRVAVTLKPIHYDHVEVRIGSTVFRIDGTKTVKIRPGSYQIDLRKGPNSAWGQAGRLTVELGTRYRVKLYDPPLSKVETLE